MKTTSIPEQGRPGRALRPWARLALSAGLASALALAALADVEPAAAQGHAVAAHAGDEQGQHEAGHDAAIQGAAIQGAAAHGSPGHGSHDQPVNWFNGLLGAKKNASPSVLWRTPDMPPPVAALLINTVLLVWVLVRFGRAPVVEGLKARRQALARGIEEAARLKAQAEADLANYRSKLDNLDAEIARVKADMRAAAEQERQRVLGEAAVRRQRLEQEARTLIEQERKAMVVQARRESVAAALAGAKALIGKHLTLQDDRRLCDAYLDRGLFQQSGTPSSVPPAPVSGSAPRDSSGGLR